MFMFYKKKKGFSLVELLVVIAIIGTLATIVLINLNKAREKAKNVAIKAALSELRATAEMYYDENNSSYTNLCDSADVGRIGDNIIENGKTLNCKDSSTQYCGEVELHGGDTTVYWCVDHTGVSKGNTVVTCVTGNEACD